MELQRLFRIPWAVSGLGPLIVPIRCLPERVRSILVGCLHSGKATMAQSRLLARLQAKPGG